MTLLLAYFVPAALAQDPDWRVLRDHSPAATLIAELAELADPDAGARVPSVVKDRLSFGLEALIVRPGDTVRRYVTRIDRASRARLSERAPAIVRRLTDREPHLRVALAAARRRDDPSLSPRRWRERWHDRVLIAWARLSRRRLTWPTPSAAAAAAPAVARLERLLRDGTWTAEPLTPAEELIEVLEEYASTAWSVGAGEDEDILRFIRYAVAKWDAIEDLREFAKIYRDRVGPAARARLAEVLPPVATWLKDVESPGVVAAIERLHARALATTPEADVARNVRNLGFAALGAITARWLGPKLEEDLARNRAEEARAVRWLKIDRIMRGGEQSALVAGCEAALASLKTPGASASRPGASSR